MVKILIMGCTGLIGSEIFRQAKIKKNVLVFGTYKTKKKIKKLDQTYLEYFNANNKEDLVILIKKIKPDFLINAIGITKHIKNKNKNKKNILKINSFFPHYAKKIANKNNCKFIQISTDCVFNGKKGNYKESDKPNATDIYGISKARGEIIDNKNLTIRTSTIGHEIYSKYGLLEWFLSQKKVCFGFKNAKFNGLPTYYFSRALLYILLKTKIVGVIHISGKKISKLSLLKKIKKIYKKKINIKINEDYVIDRTLNNKKFKKIYSKIPNWSVLISNMKKNNDFSKYKFI